MLDVLEDILGVLEDILGVLEDVLDGVLEGLLEGGSRRYVGRCSIRRCDR